ncbi:CLUMA_CG020311, isoform A [Clunio marinus]|uniref:CLUMA_CG020311, isoform A n=1 Tax=Clunio marinus TaxID=568069 RepID=A0A1J1J6C6_9DIPT|nr:CLUMA_CG020311, isoform A [Clunio marinus]
MVNRIEKGIQASKIEYARLLFITYKFVAVHTYFPKAFLRLKETHRFEVLCRKLIEQKRSHAHFYAIVT